MYSDIILQHFKSPKNSGEIPDANGIGFSEDSKNGNVVKIWIKVRKNLIVKSSFKSNGCVPVIACCSCLTEIVKGKTLKSALTIQRNYLIKALQGLPQDKYHCADIALTAFNNAVSDFQSAV